MTNPTTAWNALVEEFRSYGGRAENVVQRDGPFGRGLFPIDPSQPIDLMVPRSLLVPAENVELQNGAAVIKDDSAFPNGYADWFRRYQDSLSWGAEGELSVTRFETGLRNLPNNVGELLSQLNLYQPEHLLAGKTFQHSMLRRFLKSRCLSRRGKLVVMPMVELVNHSPKATNWEIRPDGSVGVSGHHDGEVLVKYSNADPLRRLLGFGFNVQEPLGFSLSLNIRHRGQLVEVKGGGGRHWFQPPVIEEDNKRLVIEQPLLGCQDHPRMPLTLFLSAFQSANRSDGEELFERIHQANTLALVELLRRLDAVPDEIASLLRLGCMNQLSSLSHHIGHRAELLSRLGDEITRVNSSIGPDEPWDNPPV